MEACAHGHQVSAELARDWCQVRTRKEPACATCAGEFGSKYRPERSVQAHLCAGCGTANTTKREIRLTERTRYFCTKACQTAFYEAQRWTNGVKSQRAIVVGVLAPWSQVQDDSVPRVTEAERASARRFFNFSTHDEMLRNFDYGEGVGVLPAYPHFGDLFGVMDSLNEAFEASEQRYSYTSTPLWKAAESSGSEVSRRKAEAWSESTHLVDSQRLFAKRAVMWPGHTRQLDAYRALLPFQNAEALDADSPATITDNISALWRTSIYVEDFEWANNADDILTLRVLNALLVHHYPVRSGSSEESDIRRIFTRPLAHWGYFHPSNILGLKAFMRRFTKKVDSGATVLSNFASRYATYGNVENMNDIVAGARITTLVQAHISPAFTPLVDSFVMVMPRTSDPKMSKTATYAISASNDALMQDETLLFSVPSNGTTLQEYVERTRSVLAQVLLALEAGQHHLEMVHYDLSVSNTMLLRLPQEYAGKRMLFGRPDNTKLFVPTDSTKNHLVRFIDYGRMRVKHPDPERTDATFNVIDPYSSSEFDSSVDMRTFGYNFLGMFFTVGWYPTILSTLRDDNAPEFAQEVLHMLDVFDAMIGAKHFTRLNKKYPTLGLKDPRKTGGKLGLSALGLLKRFHKAGLSVFQNNEVTEFRLEFYGRREDKGAPFTSPSMVLNMPFFDKYRNPPPDGDAQVDFMGDAAQTLDVAKGRMAERSE